MYTTQVVLLSGEGKISTAIVDSLPEHLHVQQIPICNDGILDVLQQEKSILSNADIAILNLSEIKGKAEQALSIFATTYPNTPIIVMHLYNQKTFAEAFLKMGANAYLPINFYTEDLLSAIDSVLLKKNFIAKNVY